MEITLTIPRHFHKKWFFGFLAVSCINEGVLQLNSILVTCPLNDQDNMIDYALNQLSSLTTYI